MQIHAYCTVVGQLVPALLPKDAVVLEQGCYFIDGSVKENMIEVSPDGFIDVSRTNQMNNHYGVLEESAVLEIKCPYPNKRTLPVHYKIPLYYSTQLLLEMHAKGTRKAW